MSCIYSDLQPLQFLFGRNVVDMSLRAPSERNRMRCNLVACQHPHLGNLMPHLHIAEAAQDLAAGYCRLRVACRLILAQHVAKIRHAVEIVGIEGAQIHRVGMPPMERHKANAGIIGDHQNTLKSVLALSCLNCWLN